MKKFKNWRHAEGFTLVELIVVIAILAILGGVAVPAYSGYVQKAEYAADEALLAEVNMAFAAACAMNGESHIDHPEAKNQIIGADKLLHYEGANEEYFNNFYEGGQFKVMTALFYDPDTGMFGEGQTFKYGNTAITVSKADVQKLLASTWGKKLTSQQILNMVDGAVDNVTLFYDKIFENMVGDEKFRNAAAAALGVESYDDYVDALIDAEAKKRYEAANPGKSWETDADDFDKLDYTGQVEDSDFKSNLDSNVAVLVAAQGAQAQKDTVLSILTTNGGTGAKDTIKATLQTDSTTGLSQAAVAYGLYHAYIYSQDTLTDEQKAEMSKPSEALKNFADPGFQTYLADPQSTADLDGFMASMNVISGQDSTVAGSVVQSGITDPNLEAALKDILGK